MAKTTNTIKSSTPSLDALFNNSGNTVKEIAQVTGSKDKESKVMGVSVGIVTLVPNVPGTFLGSAFRNDIGFLKPLNYDKGLPELKQNPSVEAQIYHLSVQRQHEEYRFFETVGNQLLESGEKEITIKAEDIDSEQFPFMAKLWGNTGIAFYFHNNTIKSAGVELSSEDVNTALNKLFG